MSVRHMFQLFCGYSLWYMQSYSTLIPVAQRSKAWGYGFSLAGSNPAGGNDLSPVSLVCQAVVSATGWSLVQRSPTECGVSIVEPQRWGPGPLGLSSHENPISHDKRCVPLISTFRSMCAVSNMAASCSFSMSCFSQACCSGIFWTILKWFQPPLFSWVLFCRHTPRA